MSRFILNKSCEMCHKIETGLVEMRVDKTNHYLCYNCMTSFTLDIIDYASHNLREEFKTKGYTIECTNDAGFIIEPNEVYNRRFNETKTCIRNLRTQIEEAEEKQVRGY